MAFTGKELPSWLSAYAVLLYAILMVCVHFPFGVGDRMWNSIVSVPDHCLFIYYDRYSGMTTIRDQRIVGNLHYTMPLFVTSASLETCIIPCHYS